jgi:hypothetical protein
MNCYKSHELTFGHELANAMKDIARGVYKQSGPNDIKIYQGAL